MLPSPTIACEHAQECAGCPLIAHPYAEQLARKQARVEAALDGYPALRGLTPHAIEAAPPITGYRGRAKLMVSPKGALGMYGHRGHEVVDIPGCHVLAPALAEVAAVLRALIAEPPDALRPLLAPLDSEAGGALGAVDLREVRGPGGGEPAVLVTLVLQRDRAAGRDVLTQAGARLRPLLPRAIGLAANLREAGSPQVLGPETILLDGASHAEDVIGASYHVASFGSFVQAHRHQAACIHAHVERALRPDTGANASLSVLDLYGGSGAIALALARQGHRLTMVESFAPAAESAGRAARAQGLLAFDVHTGDAARLVADFADSSAAYDAVVVNPPRRGVSAMAREALARLGAPRIAYVSCDPDTLARDLDHLGRLGYATRSVAPFDMIPLTEEVETVATLVRAEPTPPRVLYEDDELIVVDKSAHEPVVSHPAYAGSLIERARDLSAGALLRSIHAMDVEASGLCFLARTERAATLWQAALAETGKLIHLVGVRGPAPVKGAIQRPLRDHGRVHPARTRYRRLALLGGHALVRAVAEGGRIHQLRRHFAAVGHPVLGDRRYGHEATNRYFEERMGLDRSFVHLGRVEVTHPRTGKHLVIDAALPGELRLVAARASGGKLPRFLE
jgi:23S rRNA (uracil1939-C5)-methyltransferase